MPIEVNMLQGTRVFLRPLEEEDLSVLVGWRNLAKTWATFFNKVPLSYARQKHWFETLLRDEQRFMFMICTVSSGEAIGTIGLDRIDFANQCGELGNVLIGEADARGKGLAGEAIDLLVEYCFQRLNLHRLTVFLYKDNEQAMSLYRSRGFEEEGVLREARFDEGRFKHVSVMGLLRQ
jgi:RimJ/RimL family protein N-acetyltransferase